MPSVGKSTLLGSLALLGACLGPVRTPAEGDADDDTGPTGSTRDATLGSDSTLSSGPSSEAGSTSRSTSTSTDPTETDAETSVGPRTSTSTDGSGDGLVEVGHTREFRGTWVATVFNINFPTDPGLTVAAQREQLLEILDVVQSLRLNVVLLQVRPESDALYDSDLEPWSRFLSGSQGTAPGYDPLLFAVEEAHARGIEVHAWINPYRAKVDADTAATAEHVSQVLSPFAYLYDDGVWMDPAPDAVRAHVVDVALDIADRYEVDGLQMDDYYYPYPDDVETPFPDDATWQAYVSGGGHLSRANWRRNNVNRLIESLHDELLEAAPDVRFGTAPFGIYRPGLPPGTTGLDQYATLYADPLHWVQEGWVDYLAPQLYWSTTQPQQAYDVLLEWWAALPSNGQHLFAANAAYKIVSDPAHFDADEILLQVQITRDAGEPVSGNIFYNVETLLDDTQGVATSLAETLYTRPALTPPLPRPELAPPSPPEAAADSNRLLVDHPDRDALRAFVLYAEVDGEFLVERIEGPLTEEITVTSGRWALSVADRFGVESLGTVVEID